MRAKFKISSITQTAHWNKPGALLYSLTMSPVTSGSDENRRFFEATPGGEIKLSVVSAEVGAQFPVGMEVYVDFTPVPVAVPAADTAAGAPGSLASPGPTLQL